ncbi:MAG: Holliday junction branch migration protein RuvA [bacterium]
MICHVQGVIAEKTPTRIVLDVNGVGYELFIPVTTYEKVGEIGQQTKLLTYLHVREDALQLYGFFAQQEKWMFTNLISVSGIGPKLALGILSGCTVDNLKHFIVNGELESLTTLSGVGKKTAQRLITELREKLGGVTPETEFLPTFVEKEITDKFEEAVLALVSLGYPRVSAQRAIEPILKREQNLPLEDLIRKALQSV